MQGLAQPCAMAQAPGHAGQGCRARRRNSRRSAKGTQGITRLEAAAERMRRHAVLLEEEEARWSSGNGGSSRGVLGPAMPGRSQGAWPRDL